MGGWTDMISSQKVKSANQAKERLRLVLINDRTDITPDMLERMKNEILEVISRYVEIEPSTVRIQMAQEGREHRLIADIPLKPIVQRRRIG